MILGYAALIKVFCRYLELKSMSDGKVFVIK